MVTKNLAIVGDKCNICGALKGNKMFALRKKYGLFAGLMDEGRVYENPLLKFGDICRMIGVSPASLDDLLREELGLGGEELLASRRSACG